MQTLTRDGCRLWIMEVATGPTVPAYRVVQWIPLDQESPDAGIVRGFGSRAEVRQARPLNDDEARRHLAACEDVSRPELAPARHIEF